MPENLSPQAQDERIMQRALSLARDAAGLASPNPTVGCVIARDETILAEGAHLYDACDHAEIVALKQAAALGQSVRGATAYVTLEPCAHHGRTGPCSDALIGAGIARCVVATIDPNPLVSGKGLAKLRAAGVEVLLTAPHSALTQQARQLNDAFACFIQHHRPFVTLKAALSVDGKLAPPSSSRTQKAPHWITGTAARADAQVLRHNADALLTGIGTVLADNPLLTDRTGLPRRRPLLRIVADSDLRVPPDSALVASAASDLIIFCAEDAPADRESALRSRNVEVVRIPTQGDRLDLRAAFAVLAERNLLSILVEAGSTLNASLLRADLVDKLVLYHAESELGPNAVPFAADFGSPCASSPYEIEKRLMHTTRASFPSDITPGTEDVHVSGYLHDPWARIVIPNPHP